MPIVFEYDSQHQKFRVDFTNYGILNGLPAQLNGVINEDSSICIELSAQDQADLNDYLKFDIPPLQINENLEFFLKTIHKKGKEWKIDLVTKKNFSYFFGQSEVGSFTQKSITALEKSWSIKFLNFEILSQVYVFTYLKPLYDYEFSKLENINESQLTLEDYQTIGPEKLIVLDENIFLEFKRTAYWDDEITSKKESMDKDQFENFKGNRHILIRDQVLKAVCGLHNSEGGLLVIGVEDKSRKVTGIELDMENNDSLEQKEGYRKWLVNIISSHVEEKLGNNIKIKFDTVNGKTIARVNVPRRDHNEKGPCATTYGNRKVVFKRGDEETIEIKPTEILDHFKARFY